MATDRCRSPFNGSSSGPAKSRGFTLIELIVVIGIIIVATGFIVPTLTKFFRHRKLSNAGTLITQTMNEARNAAVTKKQAVSVVFLRKGLRVYDHGTQSWEGGLKPIDPTNSSAITYRLRFSKYAKIDQERIPEKIMDLEAGPGAEAIGEELSENIFITFKPDGTVDFGENQDISSAKYKKEPPLDADIIIDQKQDRVNHGYIDIRATGRVMFKVSQIRD